MQILKLLRINNWVKNVFILMPLFFSGQFFDYDKFLDNIIVLIGFSLIASSVYIINDLFDLKYDKTHPEKKFRPLASGKISIGFSIKFAILLVIIGHLIIYVKSLDCMIISFLYFTINLFYSYKLKQIPIIDFVIISIGFVLRLFIGGEISSIELSNWIIIMVLLISIFIAASKRRDDVYNYEIHNKIHRDVVKKYNLIFIDKIITIVSSVLIVSYLLFITSEEILSKHNFPKILIFTFLLVLIGILRFNQITYVHKKSSSPIKIFFKDSFLQIILIIWILSYLYVIYNPYFNHL